MNKSNKIISQGEYDGACFLYSAANAYRTLIQKKPTQKRWNEMLKWIPFASDFISTNGTLRYDNDMALYKFTLERYFNNNSSSSSFSFEISPYPDIKSPSELSKLIQSNSVVILNINSEHWVACVELDNKCAFVACSDQLRIKRENYIEYKSPIFKRQYNLEMAIGTQYRVHNPSVFQIKLL